MIVDTGFVVFSPFPRIENHYEFSPKYLLVIVNQSIPIDNISIQGGNIIWFPII